MQDESQLLRLKRMADKIQNSFQLQGLAETAFLISARFQSFDTDMIDKTARQCWPNGYSAQKGKTNRRLSVR